MNLLSFLFFSSCDRNYSSPIFTRCRVTNDVTKFSGAEQTIVYLHTSSSNVLHITTKSTNYTINPGMIFSLSGQNISAYCSSVGGCDVSIWHSPFSNPNSFHINDAAGAVFKLSNQLLPSKYVCYYDFGLYTKVKSDYIYHSRVGPSVQVSYYNYTTNKVVTTSYHQHNTFNFLIDSPGVLSIERSEYTNISFRIVIGATYKISDEFIESVSSGEISLLNNTKDDTIASITPFNKKMERRRLIMSGISVLVFISTFVSLGFLIRKIIQWRRKKLNSSIDLSDLSVSIE